jgi:hypothetical protein
MTSRFGVLGTVEVWRDGEALPVPSGRTRLALAVLRLAPGRFATTDRLIDVLWQDPPRHAKPGCTTSSATCADTSARTRSAPARPATSSPGTR